MMYTPSCSYGTRSPHSPWGLSSKPTSLDLRDLWNTKESKRTTSVTPKTRPHKQLSPVVTRRFLCSANLKKETSPANPKAKSKNKSNKTRKATKAAKAKQEIHTKNTQISKKKKKNAKAVQASLWTRASSELPALDGWAEAFARPWASVGSPPEPSGFAFEKMAKLLENTKTSMFGICWQISLSWLSSFNSRCFLTSLLNPWISLKALPLVALGNQQLSSWKKKKKKSHLDPKGPKDPCGQDPQEDQEDIQRIFSLHQISPAPTQSGQGELNHETKSKWILEDHCEVLRFLTGFIIDRVLRLPAHYKGIAKNDKVPNEFEGVAVYNSPNRWKRMLRSGVHRPLLLFLRGLRNPGVEPLMFSAKTPKGVPEPSFATLV